MLNYPYRAITVPRLFGLGVMEGVALFDLLGSVAQDWVTGVIKSEVQSSSLDSLPGLLACESLATWLRAINLAPSALRQLLGLSAEIPVETPELVRFAQELRENAIAECLLSERFIQRGFPALDLDGQVLDWHRLLSTVLDPQGLVLAFDDAHAQATITEAAAAAVAPLNLAEADKARLKPQAVTLLLEARAAQAALASTALAKLFGSETALVPGLLQWAASSPYALLAATFETAARQVAGLAPSAASTPYVELLYRLSRYAQVIAILQLSAPALALFLAHPGWLDGDPLTVDLPLVVPTVYWLSRWRDLVNQSPLAEEKVLSYLMAANAVTPPEDCAARLAEVLDWDQTSVEALFADVGHPLRSLEELDWAMRMQKMTRELRVPVSAVLTVRGATAALPRRDEYQPLARALMASLGGEPDERGEDSVPAPAPASAQPASRGLVRAAAS
ncbi:hypothetical protein [Trinickia mobilis]|uniref:hypothetical protein n=1 Tax=Trinickia mobilis TaxID=2816356 RepID=UPI001A8F51F5|nr:hypothetical protein [Trinickia mobilis]